MKFFKKFLVSSLLIMIFVINPASASADGNPTPEENASEEQKKVDIPEPKMGEPEKKAPEKDTAEEIVELDIETPASVTGQKMEGNGTVVDFSTSGSKAFYTIVDGEQQVFYLVIDMDKTDNNVYFLSDINKSELEGVQGNEDGQPIPAPEQEVDAVQVEEPKESGNGFFIFILIAGVAFLVGYYFLVFKKKQGQTNDEYEDEDDMMEGNYEDDMIVDEVSDQANKEDK